MEEQLPPQKRYYSDRKKNEYYSPEKMIFYVDFKL